MDTLWVIGGEQIYNEFILNEKYNRQIDYIYMTKIYEKYECDKFFPVYKVCANINDWKLIYKNDDYENYIHKPHAPFYINLLIKIVQSVRSLHND